MTHETPDGVAHPEFGPRSTGPDRDPDAASWSEADSERPAGEDDGETSTPVRTELEDLAVEAERLVRDGIEQTERRIRRHPLASVGIAAGVGLLLGLMCGRGR